MLMNGGLCPAFFIGWVMGLRGCVLRFFSPIFVFLGFSRDFFRTKIGRFFGIELKMGLFFLGIKVYWCQETSRGIRLKFLNCDNTYKNNPYKNSIRLRILISRRRYSNF